MDIGRSRRENVISWYPSVPEGIDGITCWRIGLTFVRKLNCVAVGIRSDLENTDLTISGDGGGGIPCTRKERKQEK